MPLLHHATTLDAIEDIRANGLHPGAYFVHEDWDNVIEYYESTVEDEGKTPVRLTIDSTLLEQDAFVPDRNGIDEPLTYTLGMTEKEVMDKWEESGQTWQDCIELIGTCRYSKAIDPLLITFPNLKASPRP